MKPGLLFFSLMAVIIGLALSTIAVRNDAYSLVICVVCFAIYMLSAALRRNWAKAISKSMTRERRTGSLPEHSAFVFAMLAYVGGAYALLSMFWGRHAASLSWERIALGISFLAIGEGLFWINSHLHRSTDPSQPSQAR